MKSGFNRTIGCIFLIVIIHSGCKSDLPEVKLTTPFGDIIVELYPEKVPITVTNFLKYIEQGLYSDAVFYRVVRMDNQPNSTVKIEVIQGGLYNLMDSLALAPIEHETTERTGILHKNGVISMARYTPGTASSEFFICIGDQPELDFNGTRNSDGQGFAAFGKVIDGMDVVQKIQQEPDNNQYLPDPIPIVMAKRIK
jgi:peptidyl-prolyl cis-trans isomerase A (cyclophilin A)